MVSVAISMQVRENKEMVWMVSMDCPRLVISTPPTLGLGSVEESSRVDVAHTVSEYHQRLWLPFPKPRDINDIIWSRYIRCRYNSAANMGIRRELETQENFNITVKKRIYELENGRGRDPDGTY